MKKFFALRLSDVVFIMLTWFSNIDNVYAGNQQIMQKW